MFGEALESYRMAKEFAERYLGATDGITINLTNIYEKAKKEIGNQQDRDQKRIQDRDAARAKQLKIMGSK